VSTDLAGPLLEALAQQEDLAVQLRHRLHRAPDVSGHEGPTRDLVLDALPPGLVIPVAGTGAVVRIGASGPAIGVRGELDALRLSERSGVEWASERQDAMHACGHDVHLAAVVALSHAVAHTPGAPPLAVVLQPREESYPSGAQDIVESGVLLDNRVTAMVGAHVQPSLKPGVIACTAGAVNAAADEFRVTVRGCGGHAAYPHLTRDPVLALAHVVVALQQVVGRNTDPMNSAVVSVSTLSAGEAANVIPDVAVARGTVRSMSEPHRARLHRRIREVAEWVAQAHECTAEVDITSGEPVLVNEPAIVGPASEYLRHLGFQVDGELRSFGADDFSFYPQQVPALMMFVGVDGRSAGLHHPEFAPGDEAVMDVARTLLAGYLAAAEFSSHTASTAERAAP
jgi:amidohydrolase